MELRHLRYFQAVAEELSFTKAAVRLSVAQPALSRAVQELEHSLGVRLLDRDRRGVRLTPAGAVLLRDTELLLERLEETVRRVQRADAGESGELRLGYIGPPTRPFLARLLRAYAEACPGVTVVLEERTPERVWEMVSRGKLSVGLTRPVLAHEALGLPTRLLRSERLCAAVPAGHPFDGRRSVPWGRLADEPIVMLARREGAGSHDAIIASCQEAGFTPKLAHTPSLIGTILQYVEAGAGVGIVPESASVENDTVKLVPLSPRRTIPLVMVWSREGEDAPASAFRELVTRWDHEGVLFPESGGSEVRD